MSSTQNVAEILLNLAKDISISGNEKRFTDKIKSYFANEEMNCDALNSLRVQTYGTGKFKFLLDAHIDQIGLIVTDITENGFIKVASIGGVDSRILSSCDVLIKSRGKDYKGVVSSIPPHLSERKEGTASEVSDLLIDIGLSKTEAEKVVRRGDVVAFNYPCEKLINEKVVSASLDNKVGVTVLIRVYQILKEMKADADVTFVFSSQEELGLRGAKCASFNQDADEAIVVDVSFSTAPDVNNVDGKDMGKGPLICVSPIIDKKISDNMISVSEEKRIPYQIEVCSKSTGTNADVVSVSNYGIKTSLVSVPIRNMHTFSEVVSLEDIELSAKLIAEYILKKVKEHD